MEEWYDLEQNRGGTTAPDLPASEERMIAVSEEVKMVVNRQIERIESDLPGFLTDYYLNGSIALGAFDYGKSDVDFVAVTKGKATQADIASLKRIHGELQREHRETVLDGMY